jgi:hypothetical protein
MLKPTLPRSPLSNRFCRCPEIILQNGCQVVNRVIDFSGDSINHRITSEISRQQAGRLCTLVNIKWFHFNKRGVFFFVISNWCIFPVVSIPPIFPVMRTTTRKAGYRSYSSINYWKPNSFFALRFEIVGVWPCAFEGVGKYSELILRISDR